MTTVPLPPGLARNLRLDRWVEIRTDGVVEVLRVLGGGWRIAAACVGVMPKGWRDAAYGLVARGRYRIWGEYRAKPLARAEWAARFLE